MRVGAGQAQPHHQILSKPTVELRACRLQGTRRLPEDLKLRGRVRSRQGAARHRFHLVERRAAGAHKQCDPLAALAAAFAALTAAALAAAVAVAVGAAAIDAAAPAQVQAEPVWGGLHVKLPEPH